jgi:AraC-like DNA-binding protein
MHSDEVTRASDGRLGLDADAEAFRRNEASGLLKRFSRQGARIFVGTLGGSGVVDVVRVNGVEIDVNNCVLPALRRRYCLADELVIMLRASLSCDVVLKESNSPPVVFNRPELTLVCVPKGMQFTMDGQGGVRQQTMNGIFRGSALARAYGLKPADLPPVVQEALAGTAAFGRVVSLPLDHRVASLVADTIDSPLEGEMRTLQIAARMAELVAYTMDAIRKNPAAKSAPGDGPPEAGAAVGASSWRAADLAQLALDRLSRSYRKPPLFDDLAAELGTNLTKLKASFKSSFGITMAEYCLQRRMREAQQLLLEAKLSMAEVADRVGYAHQSNFSAAFSGHLGMSPREYCRHRAAVHLSLGTSEVGLEDRPSRGAGRR